MLGASAGGYNALFDEATGAAEVGRIALNVVLLVLGAAVGGAGAAIFGGPLAVFLRAHALYFYGSRYKPLAQLLWPAPALVGDTGVGTFPAVAVSNRTADYADGAVGTL